jgi:hypothetical protein
VRAARGEAEEHVARRDGAPVDDAVFLHHADAEPGEVILVLRIHARHLGGLAADERAARDLAAARAAAHHGFPPRVVELAACYVVE